MTVDFALSLRPKSLNDICGQKMIVAEMKRRSLTNDFPSVMIFGGDSGTGKTTVALIIGALMNDEDPIKQGDYNDPNPNSPEYKAVYGEKFNRNVCFYDASKMGKEDVIALEDVVSTKSLFGGKKVIIIDEAQELSRHSKGATLKLLEKKREDVCIILCTMNPEVFDKSIRSRGSFYTFKSPTPSDIGRYLFNLAAEEKGALPEEFINGGLMTIAENCEGSVRMAVQTLERCLYSELYTADAIQQEFGFITSENLLTLIKMLIRKDTEFFKAVVDLGMKEFFYQSYKVVSDALVYLRTGYTDVFWKKAQFDTFKPFLNDLTEVFTLYAEIDRYMAGYFRESYCRVRLSEYLAH